MNSDSILVGPLFVVGMTVPVIGSMLAHDVLSLYLSGRQFTYLVAVAFCLIVWIFLEVVDPDRLTFFMWSLVFPWLITLGIVILAISTEMSPGLGYLFYDVGGLMAYGGSFMLAGVASLVIRKRIDRASRQYPRLPRGRSIAFGVAIVGVIAILAGGTLLTVFAMSASVSDVEPGVLEHRTPVLNVTIDDKGSEMRLRVTGPEGSTYISRISQSVKGSDPITVPVRFHGDLPSAPEAGTYHVELTAISGIRVDSATYTVDKAPSPSVLDMKTAGPGQPLEFDVPENATVYRPSPGPTDPQTRVAVVVENTGDVAADFDTVVHLKPGLVDSREIFVKPGQKGVNIIGIQEKYVERIHERSDGRITVEVVYEETRIVKEVALPQF